MTDSQLLAYIDSDWPDISDKTGCIRWLTHKYHGIVLAPGADLDQLCCFWMRHEHD